VKWRDARDGTGGQWSAPGMCCKDQVGSVERKQIDRGKIIKGKLFRLSSEIANYFSEGARWCT